jgi:ADP-heptose:LPS heptosyltransferase
MRVLALVPGGVDDQLRFFPTINQIKDSFDQAEVAVVADPSAKDIYRLSKVVSEVIPYSFQTRNSPADWANLLGVVRDREFEVVLTLTQSWSMALLLWLSGVPTRLGYAGSANRTFLTDTVPLKPEQPLAQQYQDLLQAINIPGPAPALTVNVPQSDITAVEALRRTQGITEGYILVYPGASPQGDIYGVDQWLIILQDFQQRQPSIPVVLVKTAASAATIVAIQRQMSGLKVIEPDNAGQMAALIAGANLLVAVDSYALYLATALQVYAVGLFNDDAADSLPLPSPEATVRTLAVKSPNGTLAGIAPDVVLKKIWNEA